MLSWKDSKRRTGFKTHRQRMTIVLPFLSLVKAFLAKAKDEFQAKYDKPSQVKSFSTWKVVRSIDFSLVQNTAKPEDFDRIRTLGTGEGELAEIVQSESLLSSLIRFVRTCYAC